MSETLSAARAERRVLGVLTIAEGALHSGTISCRLPLPPHSILTPVQSGCGVPKVSARSGLIDALRRDLGYASPVVSSTPSRVSVDAYPIAVPVAVGAASAVVIVASLLVAFRLDFASDLPTLLTVNGPRVLFAAAAGGCWRSLGRCA